MRARIDSVSLPLSSSDSADAGAAGAGVSRPKTLVQGFGDLGPEGSLTDSSGQRTGANSSHNTVLWSYRGKAYAAVQDNTEFHDVDIFDISDPRSPKPVAEHDLVELFPSIVETPSPNGNWIYNHDDFVKLVNATRRRARS
jgi:hypothetical protein